MRVLVVSYAFPPVGGAGVQRAAKLVKYLPEHGCTPLVLSVKNPSTPLMDETLLDDVDPAVEVVRVRTLEPGYAAKRVAWHTSSNGHTGLRDTVRHTLTLWARALLIPDPQVLWLPGAATGAIRLLRGAAPPQVLFITGPPFSQFALSLVARARPGTAIVLDYRDEWTTTRSVYEMSVRSAERLSTALERRFVRAAHAITTATEAFRQELLARFEFLRPEQVRTIENGYDPADFDATLPSPAGNQLVVTYVGTVFRLTSARGLLSAIRLLHERSPDLARLLRVRFVGRIVETELDAFADARELGVERTGYLPHRLAIRTLAASHLALCLLDDVAGAERVYPAKIFEIARLGRPCLALCPRGALADLVRDHQLGEVVPPRDRAAIADVLERRVRELRAGTYRVLSSPVDIERFDRRRQAGEFAAVFEQAVARAGATRSSAALAATPP